MDYDASEDTSSASEGHRDRPIAALGAAATARKPKEHTKTRKTTYYMRKDEINILREQLAALKAKLRQYKTRSPRPPEPPAIPWGAISDTLAANAFLAHHVDYNSLMIAGTQSMTTAYNLAMVQDTGIVPLRSFIHLPRDSDARVATLGALHMPKLAATARYMAERTRYLDLRVNHRQLEQFELPNGDAVTMGLFVTQFRGGHSLRQVFDAFKYFVVHEEICIFEQLGVLTVRESDELDSFRFGQTRLLSTLPCGLEMECNFATFAECMDATENSPAYAVSTLDFVDQDDLYPYRPDMCLRKELTGAVTLHELPSLSGGKPTIAMVRWAYMRIPAPKFQLPVEAETAVTNDVLQWCESIPAIMNKHLEIVSPA